MQDVLREPKRELGSQSSAFALRSNQDFTFRSSAGLKNALTHGTRHQFVHSTTTDRVVILEFGLDSVRPKPPGLRPSFGVLRGRCGPHTVRVVPALLFQTANDHGRHDDGHGEAWEILLWTPRPMFRCLARSSGGSGSRGRGERCCGRPRRL